MHHALEIQEILSCIFYCCRQLCKKGRFSLTSLARTCRAFKEPALDVLWEELFDLSPLARCLPEACHRGLELPPGPEYSFSRPLTQIEWDTLQSYTRRIRLVWDFGSGLDEESLVILLDAPVIEPLFPNLRHLYYQHQRRTKATHLLRLPFPSLVSLHIPIENPDWFKDALQSLPDSSPNIRNLAIKRTWFDAAFSKLASNCICRWQNLETVACPRVALDVDALVHLSRMPALTLLHCVLSATLPTFDLLLSFSSLHRLKLRSGSLRRISQFLLQVRLPAVTEFLASVDDRTSKQELLTFWSSFQTSGADHVIEGFTLDGLPHMRNAVRSEALLLSLEDLQPCMAFGNLRCLTLNVEWDVGLADDDLLALGRAWPRLEELLINPYSGWNARGGGVTPNGLVQLLQTCRSLVCVALAIDTRGYGYAQLSASGLLASAGRASPYFWLSAVDSTIEAGSVPAVAAFLASTPCCRVVLDTWFGVFGTPPGWRVYKDRWDDVRGRIGGVYLDS